MRIRRLSRQPRGRSRVLRIYKGTEHLPPHSPGPNLVERARAKLEQLLCCAQARTNEILEQAIIQALKTIAPDNVKAWIRLCIIGLPETLKYSKRAQGFWVASSIEEKGEMWLGSDMPSQVPYVESICSGSERSLCQKSRSAKA